MNHQAKIVKENIERIYNSFYDSKDNWHFFLGIADYVKYVAEHNETNTLIEKIIKTREQDFETVIKLEKEVIKELNQSKEKLLKIIKDNGLDYESLNKEINNLKAFERGDIVGSRSESEALNDYIFQIARNLFENGHVKLLDSFIDKSSKSQNIYGNYSFSNNFTPLWEEKEKLEQKKKTEIWEAWNDLVLVYLVTFKKDEELERIAKTSKNHSWDAFNFWGLVSEMKAISESKDNSFFGNELSEPIQFKRDKYQLAVSRMHNYLLNNLSEYTDNAEKTKGEPIEYQISALNTIIKRNKEREKIKSELKPEIKKELLEEIANLNIKTTTARNTSNDFEGAVKSILIVTPQHSNFIYFWIVFNHDYDKKHRINMINKQTGQRNGVGYKLWQLYTEKKLDFDSSFLNYMNDKIFKIKTFKDFKKTKLVRIKDRKILLMENIVLEKESKENLDKDVANYFS